MAESRVLVSGMGQTIIAQLITRMRCAANWQPPSAGVLVTTRTFNFLLLEVLAGTVCHALAHSGRFARPVVAEVELAGLDADGVQHEGGSESACPAQSLPVVSVRDSTGDVWRQLAVAQVEILSGTDQTTAPQSPRAGRRNRQTARQRCGL